MVGKDSRLLPQRARLLFVERHSSISLTTSMIAIGPQSLDTWSSAPVQRKGHHRKGRRSCVALTERGRHFFRTSGRPSAPAHAGRASGPDRRIIGTYAMGPSMDLLQAWISRRRRRTDLAPMYAIDATARAVKSMARMGARSDESRNIVRGPYNASNCCDRKNAHNSALRHSATQHSQWLSSAYRLEGRPPRFGGCGAGS